MRTFFVAAGKRYNCASSMRAAEAGMVSEARSGSHAGRCRTWFAGIGTDPRKAACDRDGKARQVKFASGQ